MKRSSPFRAWNTFLYQHWQPDIDPKRYPRIRLVAAKAVASSIASHAGDDGRCFPSDGTIARDLGLHRETVLMYRHFLLDYGVFRWDGETYRNIKILRLSMPCRTPLRQIRPVGFCKQVA